MQRSIIIMAIMNVMNQEEFVVTSGMMFEGLIITKEHIIASGVMLAGFTTARCMATR